jgi:carotenoid cleavage dioxygenase-like enzyme
MICIILCLLLTVNGIFVKNKDFTKVIKHNLPLKDQKIVNKINGFFGNIGPDIHYNNSSFYDLIAGNGNIQSIFFDNGKLTFVKHLIKTEKVLFEEKNGIIPNKKIIKQIFTIFSKLKLIPDVSGLANTALLNIKNKLYALYERDRPYSIDIDFINQKINTINKINLPINHFSAHSKFKDIIETIDCDLFSNSVSIYQLTSNFNIINTKKIKLNYLPFIHDFWSNNNKICFFDCPTTLRLSKILVDHLPIYLDKTKNTIINIYDRNEDKIYKYYTNESFYMFHFAKLIEDKNSITIYASHYDDFNFNNINISGKYRKIVINKNTGIVKIEKNPILENYSLDFPVSFENKILFPNMKNNSFVICKDLHVIKEIKLNELSICGEPIIYYIYKTPYILSFAFDKINNYLLIININNNKIIKIPLNLELTFGFHSIFLNKISC